MVNAPQKWIDVYPQGCKEGDEEQKFFIALARNKDYDWRSVNSVAKDSGLSKERVDELIAKYVKKGLIFQNPTNDTLWGYWERVPHMLVKKLTPSDLLFSVRDGLTANSSPIVVFTTKETWKKSKCLDDNYQNYGNSFYDLMKQIEKKLKITMKELMPSIMVPDPAIADQIKFTLDLAGMGFVGDADFQTYVKDIKES